MGINIIRGEIGSGKSSLCMDMIKKTHKKYPSDKCIMLVPNHYSYETERQFVKEFGGTGLNNIEVMTMRKLAIQLLDKELTNYITAAGRHMLIYKSVQSYCANAGEDADVQLIASMRRVGFTDVMSSLISEFKRYMVSYDAMEESAKGIDNEMLRKKLLAAASIYKSYSDSLNNSGYTDSEDDNLRLAKKIEDSNFFDSHSHVWVDCFDEFSPQERCVIEAIAAKGAAVTISVCASDTKAIYENSSMAETTAFEIASRFGLGEVIDTGSGFKGKKRDDIRFLLDNWGGTDKVYEDKTENISLFLARDIYSEIEKTACKITDLVREENMRYRDIAILCGSTENYNHIIETVFDEYKIPYFTDSTVALSDHPIAMQLLSVFDIFENDWTYESVFRYLKAGFVYSEKEIKGSRVLLPINPSDIDRLENYVLKYGIIGASRWTAEEDWFKEDENSEKNDIDALRRRIIKPLVTLYEKTRSQQTAADFARAVFEFLCEIKLSSGLKSEIRIMRDEGLINEAEQFTKLWNLLLDVLNQTTVAMGDEEIDFQKFGEFVEVGLSQCEIRTIPSGIDQVYVGNVEKCSTGEVRAMFIVGANDGSFPDINQTEGFFSNADRNELLEEHGISIAPDTRIKLDRQYFKVYRAICAVSDRLYISRPVQMADGKALMPSPMIKDIERLMPNIMRSDDIIWDSENEHMYISTPEATIHRMLINKSVKNKNSHSPVWDAAYEWYAKQEEWRDLVALIDRAKWYMKSDIKLDEQTAKELYETKTVYSASRLNAFSLCPFGYFMRYGIKAREREIWEITPADVGSYAHEVIREFCARVEADAKTDEDKLNCWRHLTEDEQTRILDEIIDAACAGVIEKGARDKDKTVSILRRTGKNIRNAATTVCRALSSGKYVLDGLEKEFEVALTDSVSIRGIIDRVDSCKGKDETRIRIVDYKTGKTTFDIVNIANGVDMQMVIYAIAASRMAEENGAARVTGMYYNKVHNKMLSVPMGAGGETAAKAAAEELRLDGVTFVRSDEDIYEQDENMRDGESDFLNITYNSRGSLTDKNSLRTEQEMRGLMKNVTDKIIEIDSEIKSGKIGCEPYLNGAVSSCAYCSFAEVCSFLNEPRARRREGKDEDAWAKMSELGAKTED